MARGSQREKGAASEFDYWLRRCEGFRVDSPQGRVGHVEEVRYASRCDRPDLIAIRVGLLGRLLIVSVGDVEQILPREERIVLHQSPRPPATERVRHRKGIGARAKQIEVQREVEEMIERLTRRIGLRIRRRGEPVAADVEASAEPPAEQRPPEEQQAEKAEAAPAEEPAAEKPPVEERASEEQSGA